MLQQSQRKKGRDSNKNKITGSNHS